MNIMYVCGYDKGIVGGVQSVVPEYFRNMSKRNKVYVLSLGSAEFSIDNVYVIKDKIDLKEKIDEIDIVVFHEVYYLKFYSFANQLRRMSKPYIVITHGSLTDGAQTQKKWAKIIFNKLWVNTFLKKADTVQFLSEYERERSKKFKLNPVVIPNGIILNEKMKRYNLDFEQGVKLIFIGRLSVFYKGLDILLEACNVIKDKMLERNISLDIYGTDFEGGRRQLEKMVEQYGLGKIVHINDGIFGSRKESTLLEHDIFIQTSRSEGQPMGILEALQYGMPVIVTPGTTFSQIVEQNNCGWSAECNAQDIANVILKAVLNKDEWRVKSTNARNTCQDLYSWEAVTEKTIIKYTEIINMIDRDN